MEWDLFISYARVDDANGWVSGLRDAILDDFERFGEKFRTFFDTDAITSRQDWELRLRQALRTSRVLLVCLSPNYFRSPYCRWEWDEFARAQAQRIGGGDAVTGVYFVELGGTDDYADDLARWRHDVERVQLEQLQAWFPAGVTALQDAEVRRRISALGLGVHEQLRQARLAKQAPGNLRRHNPTFVGRVTDLRTLRHDLTGGASGVAVITALHGIGGMGKTELAVTYAHTYAHEYQGGTWQIDAEGYGDLLEAIATLADFPELGLALHSRYRTNRHQLGRRVLARLAELTGLAQQRDPNTANCLLLLDNVSEHAMLSAEQLAVLPDQAWLHVVATTRMGVTDIGAAGARAAVSMHEIGRLPDEDALEMLRLNQPARDVDRTHPDFSSPEQRRAARDLVTLLDGYTIAIEQAAVYLNVTGTEPAELLELLRDHGTAMLDQAGADPAVSGQIRHRAKLTGAIVDSTLVHLPARAQQALIYASLLPPDMIPWDWLKVLTNPASDTSAAQRLPGLSGGEDWRSTRRILESRRLLTPADGPDYARLHRVIRGHVRSRAIPAVTARLDHHLDDTVGHLRTTAQPDLTLLRATALSVTGLLADGDQRLYGVGLWLFNTVRQRLDLTTAHALAAEAHVAIDKLSATNPANTRWMNDLSTSLNLLGDVYEARGDTDTAMRHFMRSLGIQERLAADPADIEGRRNLSVPLERIGNILKVRGDVDAAQEYFAQSLAIREETSTARPENTGWQAGVAIAHMKLGMLLDDQRQADRALHHFRSALQIFQRLDDTAAENPHARSGIAGALTYIGRLDAARGDAASALDHFDRALTIAEDLLSADSTNPERLRDVSRGLHTKGRLLAAQGDVESALALYRRCLVIDRQLCTADPVDAMARRALAAVHCDVADMLRVLHQADAAGAHYIHSLDIMEQLSASDPTNTRWKSDLAVSMDRVARQSEDAGETDNALAQYRRAQTIRNDLATIDPGNAKLQRELIFNLNAIARLLGTHGDHAGALAHRARSLGIVEEHCTSDPTNSEWQNDRIVSLIAMGDLLAAQGDTLAAQGNYQRALSTAEKHARQEPQNTRWRGLMSRGLEKLGALALEEGNADTALGLYSRSADVDDKLSADMPDDSNLRRNRWVSKWRIADLLDAQRNPAATDAWIRVHTELRELDNDGRLADSDQKYLDAVTRRLGLT